MYQDMESSVLEIYVHIEAHPGVGHKYNPEDGRPPLQGEAERAEAIQLSGESSGETW